MLTALTFATLTSAGQATPPGSDVRLFAAEAAALPAGVAGPVGAARPGAEERTRWHLMIPLGATAVREEPVAKMGADGWVTVEMQEKVIAFDAAHLAALEAGTLELFAAQQAAGAPVKGLPISYQHAIEAAHSNGFGCMDSLAMGSNHDLRRSGTCYGVHFCDGSSGNPAGLYMLIEWTPEGWTAINDGTWHDLSISLAESYQLASGYVIGECVMGAALVDIGFFEAIPSARDGLPADAFSTGTGPSTQAVAAYRAGMVQRLFARQRTNMATDNKLRVSLFADGEAGDAAMAKIKELLDGALAPLADRLAKLETDVGRLLEHETAEGETTTAAADDTTDTTMAAATTPPVVTTNSADAIAARVFAKTVGFAEAKVAETVQAKIEAGHLLPANVHAYARCLAAGNTAGADALLGDYTGVAQRAGSSFSAGTKPVVANKPARNATEIVAEIAAEGKLKPGTTPFVNEMYARIGKAREAGTFVESV